MTVLLFGPPGSGKGTQAKDLAATLGVPHVATGDIFRRHLREGTPLGTLANSYMKRGELVPDSVTCDLVADRLMEPDAVVGVLLDGFPRSVAQARWLLGWLAERSRTADAVVSLEVPESAILERITGRRTCAQCSATYHVVYNPPGAACTTCGSVDIVQRKDDTAGVVQRRLDEYASQTAAVLPVLREYVTVYDLDGTGEIAVVKARIFAALQLA